MEIGSVASSNKLAAETAINILKKGGNAVDAAVSAAAVLGVVEPANSGLGGGGLWLLKTNQAQEGHNEHNMIMIDSREESPIGTNVKVYKKDQSSRKSGSQSCAIPGLPAAYDYINTNYGNLSLMECLEASIKYASNGFAVDEEYRRLVNARLDVIKDYDDICDIFLVNKKAPPLGHIIKQTDLAKTLKILGKKGRNGFYSGEVAKKIVDEVQSKGGCWTLKDLSDYRVKTKKPICATYHGTIINTANAPSSGGAQLLLMLKIIDFLEDKLKPQNYTEEIHLLLETMYKSYYYKHKYLGDCDDISYRITDDVLADLTKDINLNLIDRPIKKCYRKLSGKSSEQTTHLSIVDRFGNSVSATMSTNYQFGSCLLPRGTGVILNNQMGDFSMDSSSPNYVGPCKRPLSYMSPTIMENEKYIYVIGTPGGIRIANTMFLAILFLVTNPELAEKVVNLPRFHQQYYPEAVQIEKNIFPTLLIEGLEAKGHVIKNINRTWGNMQLVIYDKNNSRAFAVTDQRYAGHAITE